MYTTIMRAKTFAHSLLLQETKLKHVSYGSTDPACYHQFQASKLNKNGSQGKLKVTCNHNLITSSKMMRPISMTTYQFLISSFPVIVWTNTRTDADKNNILLHHHDQRAG